MSLWQALINQRQPVRQLLLFMACFDTHSCWNSTEKYQLLAQQQDHAMLLPTLGAKLP
jgi:hypothetical protein